MTKSTTEIGSAKAKKPHSDFPLLHRGTGRWAKKIRDRFRSFSKIADAPHGNRHNSH